MKDIITKVVIGVIVAAVVIGAAVYGFVILPGKKDDVTPGNIPVSDVTVTDAGADVSVTQVQGDTASSQQAAPEASQSGDVNATTDAQQNQNEQNNVTPQQNTTANQQGGQSSQGGNSQDSNGGSNQGGSQSDVQQTGNKIDRFHQIIESGSFLMEVDDDELGPVVMAMKGNKMYVAASLEGFTLKLIYDGDKSDPDNPGNGTWYLVLDSLKKYSKMPADMIGDMDMASLTEDMSTTDKNAVYTKDVAEIEVNGEVVLADVEMTNDGKGNTLKHYFVGDDLVRSDTISPDGSVSTTKFKSIQGNVSDAYFTIPSNYSHWNLEWLINAIS